MKIKTFAVERWMDEYEGFAVNNIAETCVDSMTVGDLLSMAGENGTPAGKIGKTRLTYGHIPGSPSLRKGIASLYGNMEEENILVMNGGSAANFMIFYTLVEPGDRVISITPSYQQLQSIPESFGAEVDLLALKPEDKFLPDLGRLAEMAKGGVKMICINNPNNPTGSLMDREMLLKVVDIADSCGAWLHCDEVYRMLVHEEGRDIPSVADLYDKGISTGSMSKAFSLAGLRIGWIAGSKSLIEECMIHRDYTTISCGMIDDMLASAAMEHKKEILARNIGIVRNNARILDEWVTSEPRMDYVRPEGGTTAFLHYDYDIPSRDFCRSLLKMNGTLLVPGECFGMENYLRIGYAFDPDVLSKGLRGISELLRQLESEGK